MTHDANRSEETTAASFTRSSATTSEAASYRCSGITRDNGRPCKRLGHRLDEEGRRWCGTHGADAHIKSPVPCAGLGTDGTHCRKTADVITIVDGVDHTLCSFHDDLYRDLGTIRAPGGYAKARHDARLALADEDEELTAAAELDESTVLDLLRARLTGLGMKTTKAVEGVLKDGLAAKKYINVTCKGCGKRSRHSIADISTRLATVKLIATELTPELNDQAAPARDVDLHELSTAQLRSAAFPEREEWITSFHRSGNLGSKVDWVLSIHERWKAGGILGEKQKTEAAAALADMKAIHSMLAPVAELSFAGERKGPWLTTPKPEPATAD
jgi:hypothetical protein